MIKVGIRAHDVASTDAKTLAQTISNYGFDGIQLVFPKALNKTIDDIDLYEIKDVFGHLKIMMLGAYFNPVHPDYHKVSSGVSNFKKHIEIARQLNANFIGTETGSLMGSPWGYVKENHDLKTIDQSIEVIRELGEHAKKYQQPIAIEGAFAHVIHQPKTVRYMLDQLKNPYIKITIDLFNFLSVDNIDQRYHIWNEAIELLKDEIVIFHLKDFVLEDGKLKLVGLGEGLMDFPYLISSIKKHFNDVYLIFEGVTEPHIKKSLLYIKKLLKEA